MPRVPKPPVKAACLACRSSKTRCDGESPCKSCYNKGRECSYKPSRRGGARRGTRYAETLKQRDASEKESPDHVQDHALRSPSHSGEDFDSFLDNTISLLNPFVGVHNLDQSPDSLSESSEAVQLWGQLTPGGDSSFDPASITNADLPTVRVYQCEEDILNAYYIYMHPYFPLLPPSPAPQYEDRSTFIQPSKEGLQLTEADLPHWPKSPLTLALSAILVLIPPIPGPSSMNKGSINARRSYAQTFALAALSSLERGIDEMVPVSSMDFVGSSQEKSPLHPQVPLYLDPILALVVLAAYEYYQRGNASRMRARINQAITTAMDLSLHNVGSTTTEFSEAQRRAWWMTMFVAYISSNLHLTPPVIASDDPRITTPFPQFGVALEPWSFMIRSQQLLYAAHSMVQKIERIVDTPPSSSLSHEIKKLDCQIVSLLIESDQSVREAFDFEGESYIAENMWRMSRIMINTARIRLHRFRAFMDIPLFLDRYCDLISINTHGFSHPSPNFITHWQSNFPFTEQESSDICLRAALVIANSFRNLPYPHPCGPDTCKRGSLNRRVMVRSACCMGSTPHTMPFLVCSAMQASYTMFMIFHQVRSCLETGRLATCYHLLNKPEPVTEISDAERLIEELRHAVESLAIVLKHDHIFEGVAGVGREIESAYMGAFPDHPPIGN